MLLNQRLPWLWALILGFMTILLSAEDIEIPSITDPVFIEDCVRLHNWIRYHVDPRGGNLRYMSWDPSLAKTARAWAKRCVFKHNINIGKKHECHPVFETVGENIWLGPLSNNITQNATSDWFAERWHYSLGHKTCVMKDCLHFTQVIWSSTYKVGCAAKLCPNLGQDTVLFVCNYAPPGNLVGRGAYVKSEEHCSLCGERDVCEERLCKNPIRDKITYYPDWNPRWEYPRKIACNPFCQFYLTIRLIGLALSVTGVYALKMRYPSMHIRPSFIA